MAQDESILREMERKELLGFILTGLDDYDRQNLLAVAPKILDLGAIRPDKVLTDHTEKELRDLLEKVCRDLYHTSPEALGAIEKLMETFEIEEGKGYGTT